RARAGALEELHLLREYRRLAFLFRVEFTSFQRKRYVNLAHEPNKAMNLNAFIGLMGKHLEEVRRADGLHLEHCAENVATWSVPDADYLLTLDADSIITPDYAQRLVHYMSVSGNEPVAVAQTPYSATPPDFGSLLIQRRRWANGGLIILPKLLRYLLRGPSRTRKAVEGFFRCHYLVSIAAVNVGLLIILAWPFEENLRDPWLPLSAAPYFFLYARDLVRAGYRYADLLRVYALNLMLIPVNLGGVLKSLEQALTGRKTPF